MTAQVGDMFKYKESQYTIVAMKEKLTFDPKAYGITPESACTACWRGFWCIYDITDDGIFVEDLFINSKDDYYPEINGISPLYADDMRSKHFYMGHHLYRGLHIRVPYTGKILVGDGFISKYYIHMGFQRAWSYKELVELVFEDGYLIEINDQSHIAAALRKDIDENFKNNENCKRDITRFVVDSFSLSYETKAWWL